MAIFGDAKKLRANVNVAARAVGEQGGDLRRDIFTKRGGHICGAAGIQGAGRGAGVAGVGDGGGDELDHGCQLHALWGVG